MLAKFIEGKTLKQLRRLVVLVVGGTVLLLGMALMVLPGPAFLVIPAGLAILATEFVWARRLLRTFREKVGEVVGAGGESRKKAVEPIEIGKNRPRTPGKE